MQENMRDNSEFTDGYWFPAEDEYRFVYADPTVLPTDPGESVPTFRMRLDENGEIVPLSVGLIRPEEVNHLPLPRSWGQQWSDAVHLRATVQTAPK